MKNHDNGQLSHLQTANIATAKNQFSRLIRQVKKGETIVITERNRPVARLQPLEPAAAPLSDLYRSGVLQPPAEANWDVEAFLIGEPCPRAACRHGRPLA